MKMKETKIKKELNLTRVQRDCLVAAGIILNVLLAKVVYDNEITLRLNTIGSIVVSLECGVFPGILTALVSSFLCVFFDATAPYFALVNIVVALHTSMMAYRGKMHDKRSILLFIFGIGTFCGVIESLIQWLLYNDTQVLFFIAVNVLDKGVSIVAALLIVKLIPKRIRQNIWKRYLHPEEEWSEAPSTEEIKPVFRRLVWMLAVDAVVLTAVVTWVSVEIYRRHAETDHKNTVIGAAEMAANAVKGNLVNIYLSYGGTVDSYSEITGGNLTSYTTTMSMLQSIQENTPGIDYVYVYQVREDGVYIVFDTDPSFQTEGIVGEHMDFEEDFLPYKEQLLAGEDMLFLENDGAYGWYMTAYVPIYDSDGNCVAYAGADMSMIDVLQYTREFFLRITLIAIAFLSMSLSFGIWMGRIYHKMMDRQHANALEAKKEAEYANVAKTRFLANMSHEIRTPINTIMGMNEMILREDRKGVPESYTKAVGAYATNIRQASELLLALINDVLDLTRIESGKVKLIEQEYDTLELLQSVVKMIRLRSYQKKLDFETDIDPILPKKLYGDEGKLKQVLLNLLTNAVKYTETGGFKLRVKVLEVTEYNCKFAVSVTDSGIGIKEKDMELLFSAFERVDEVRNSSIQGTGLGLSISREFVSLMGGDLKCRSIYGEGSTFFFDITQPIIDMEPIGNFVEASNEDIVLETYTPQFMAPKAKVMVVDDNEMNLQVIKGLLKATCVELTMVTSGKECLEKLKESDYHLVFLDHMMPEMDGLETLRRIRMTHGNLIVIALTANVASGGKDFYKHAGFQDYLAKPVQGSELEAVLRKYLPEDLQMEVNATMLANAIVDIPEGMEWLRHVDGISVADGINYCGNAEALLKFAKRFYETIEENAGIIEEAYRKKDIELYTIKVHALKSTARILGAEELSKKAELLEKAGHDKNIEFIDENTPDLLSLYRSYRETLKRVEEDVELPKEKKVLISKEEMDGAYGALRDIIAQMDSDAVDLVLEQLEEYELLREDAECIEAIKKANQRFDWDQMENLIQGKA